MGEALPYIVEEEACEVVTLAAGATQTCSAVYDVAAEATGLALLVSDLNMLGGEQQAVELNLR